MNEQQLLRRTLNHMGEVRLAEPDLFDLLNIPKPGDPGFAEYAFKLTRRMAKGLADNGWRFEARKGPRGHFYEGYGPNGRRLMSEQKPTLQEAYLVALRQANGIQFPVHI